MRNLALVLLIGTAVAATDALAQGRGGPKPVGQDDVPQAVAAVRAVRDLLVEAGYQTIILGKEAGDARPSGERHSEATLVALAQQSGLATADARAAAKTCTQVRMPAGNMGQSCRHRDADAYLMVESPVQVSADRVTVTITTWQNASPTGGGTGQIVYQVQLARSQGSAWRAESTKMLSSGKIGGD